jgi:hypothetical protein
MRVHTNTDTFLRHAQSEQLSFSANVNDAEEGIPIFEGTKRGPAGSSCRESLRRIADFRPSSGQR